MTSGPFGSQETSLVGSTGNLYRYERPAWLKPKFVKSEAAQAARALVDQVKPKDAKVEQESKGKVQICSYGEGRGEMRCLVSLQSAFQTHA